MNERAKLNELYQPIDRKTKGILAELSKSNCGFECRCGYYNYHFHKNELGEYAADYYPIPVITVEGICDIEVDFDAISITAKLSLADAAGFDYSQIADYKFEIYGVEEYCTDYYIEGDDLESAIKKIKESSEKELFFSFYFPMDVASEELRELVWLLTQGKFHD